MDPNRDGKGKTPWELDDQFEKDLKEFLDFLDNRPFISKWEPRMVLVSLIVLVLGWAFLVGILVSLLV